MNQLVNILKSNLRGYACGAMVVNASGVAAMATFDNPRDLAAWMQLEYTDREGFEKFHIVTAFA